MNKRGFTLVELLAVIVILAVVMLIGGTTVLPMMQKAQKNSLGEEGLAMLKAAEKAYQVEQLKGASAAFKTTDTVCFSLHYLCQTGYYDKGCDGNTTAAESDKVTGKDVYSGSVLVTPKNDGSYDYTFWIGNGTYVFKNANKQNYANIDDTNVLTTGTSASFDCGATSGTTFIKCGADHITFATSCYKQTY